MLFRLFVFEHGVLSSFRVTSFRFVAWRYFGVSSFRVASFCCCFFFSRGVISGRKDEMAQTIHHTNPTLFYTSDVP